MRKQLYPVRMGLLRIAFMLAFIFMFAYGQEHIYRLHREIAFQKELIRHDAIRIIDLNSECFRNERLKSLKLKRR